MKNKMITLVFLAIFIFPTMVQAETLDELIQRIASTNNQELSKLTFFELNILKNAIFSSKGYKYADDRPWLYEYFYNAKSKTNLPKNVSKWNLSQYDFPKPDPKKVFQVDPEMEKAITNVRVAIYKKIKSFKDIDQIDVDLQKEFNDHSNEQSEKFEILGKNITIATKLYLESIRREVHGYNCVLNIIKDPSEFDATELLGVYVGSVVLLKNIIEAKQGKIFGGPMGWEISQLVGITPQNSQYDENQIIPEMKRKLKLLDEIIKKMTQSDIGDVPAHFKNKGITLELYYEEGC